MRLSRKTALPHQRAGIRVHQGNGMHYFVPHRVAGEYVLGQARDSLPGPHRLRAPFAHRGGGLRAGSD
jgi:hypothetical protein